MRFRRRFSDVVERQLALFAEDHAGLLARIADARREYNDAPRDDAEDRFGDYQAWVADGTDVLVQLRDAYASTLDERAAVDYERAFNRAVARRFGDLALELEAEEPDDP